MTKTTKGPLIVPDPQMRNPAAANGREITKSDNHALDNIETLVLRQALHLRRLYRCGFATAATIASLAWGCAR